MMFHYHSITLIMTVPSLTANPCCHIASFSAEGLGLAACSLAFWSEQRRWNTIGKGLSSVHSKSNSRLKVFTTEAIKCQKTLPWPISSYETGVSFRHSVFRTSSLKCIWLRLAYKGLSWLHEAWGASGRGHPIMCSQQAQTAILLTLEKSAQFGGENGWKVRCPGESR